MTCCYIVDGCVLVVAGHLCWVNVAVIDYSCEFVADGLVLDLSGIRYQGVLLVIYFPKTLEAILILTL